MKVYLAGSFARQEELRLFGSFAKMRGHDVTSRWLTQHEESVPDAELQEHARVDLEDIDRAQAVVSFTGSGHPRGGRHVEFGYALATGKRLLLVGPRENVFHHLPGVEVFARWADALDALDS